MSTKDKTKSLLKDRSYWRDGDCFFFERSGEMIDLSLVRRISYSFSDEENYYSPGDTISISVQLGEHETGEEITIEYPWKESFIVDMRDLFKDFAEIRSRINEKTLK